MKALWQQYTARYQSPLGRILLAGDDSGLTGLWFCGQKYFARSLSSEHEEKELPVFTQAKRWLDIYFGGREPEFSVPLHLIGTDFQIEVWEILCGIPYGQTMTYGRIAQSMAEKKGLEHMSAQAVGGAVSHNSISVIVPCHRVIRADGSPGEYAGGRERKAALLKMESKKDGPLC